MTSDGLDDILGKEFGIGILPSRASLGRIAE
eukprot:CAMPEP_0185806854 /NCGR_PEP_ID=MMETSP1322-20130828/4666_1 /TAXON_ID=265543 /ORGANISM="Minutocellus polymorphus, Strain RCC2270" /LENGTH=30 /DNA_ID= /DNA_START= /DNA_END= /DNA_ORIENTATION=